MAAVATEPATGKSHDSASLETGNDDSVKEKPWYSRFGDSVKEIPKSYQNFMRERLPEGYQEKSWLVWLLMALPPFFFFIFVGLLIIAIITGRLKQFLKHIARAISSVFDTVKSKFD